MILLKQFPFFFPNNHYSLAENIFSGKFGKYEFYFESSTFRGIGGIEFIFKYSSPQGK